MTTEGNDPRPVAPSAPSAPTPLLTFGDDAVLVVAVRDDRLDVEVANAAARLLFGLGAEARALLDDNGPPHVRPLVARVHSAAGRQRATRERLLLRPASGHPFAVDLQLEPMSGPDDALRVLVVARAPDPDSAEAGGGADVDAPAATRSSTRVRAMTGVGTFRIERGLGVVFVDDTVLELLGLSHEQALGQGWLDALHPDDRPHVASVFSDPSAGDDGFDVECRVLRSGVEERWARIRGVPVRGDDGNVAGYMVSLEDVTDDRRGEGPGVRLAELAAVMEEWVGIADANWQLVYANPATRDGLALSSDDAVRAVNVLDAFTDELDSTRVEITDALRRDGSWTGEVRARALDGRTRTIGCTILRHNGPHGEPVQYSFLGRDVPRDLSERRAMEAQLAGSEAWFRALVQHAPEFLAVVARDGLVKYASPSAGQLLGYTPDELYGTRLGDFRASEADGATTARWREIMSNPGVPVHIEVQFLHRDGSPRTFEGSVTNLIDDPTVAGFVVNTRDVTHQRAAEAARRRSEAALRAIVQSSPLAIFALDRRGAVHLWNRACEQMFGWHADEVVGSRSPVLDVETEPEFARILKDVFEGATRRGYEASYVRRDGSPIDVNVALAPLREKSGRVVTAVAVVADVTEQKRAERQLRESETRFRSLVQHSSDLVTVLNEAGLIAYASPSTCRFYDRQAEALLGQEPPDVTAAEDRAPVAALFAQLRSRPGATDTITYRLQRFDGEYRRVEMVATNLLDDPAVRGIVTNTRDVTERYEAEAAVRASEERLRALVENASDVISVIDADGTLRYSSAASERVFGFASGGAIGETIFDHVHPDDRPRIVELWQHTSATRGVFRPVEIRLQRANGEWMHAEVVANNLLDNPAIKGIVVTTRDVTQRRLSEEALRESEARLRESEAHYRAVVDDQTELVCRYRPDTTLTFVNRAFAEFYGRSLHKLIGSSFVDLFSPAERGPELTRLRSFGPGREVQTTEDWEYAADGSVRWYQWTDRAFLDEDGQVVEFQSVGRDVTERRRATLLTAHQAEILEQVARGVPLGDTLDTIARTVEEQFPRLSCGILLLDEASATLRVGAALGPAAGVAAAMDGLRVGPASCSSGTAAYRREPVYVSDIATDPLWGEHRELALTHGLHSCWSTPILASDGHTVLGTLDVYQGEARPPEAEHEQIVSLLAHLASIAIERKAFEERLAHQSMHDPLTGLPNRILFLDRLGLAVARCRRTHAQVAVLFLDLDRFKNVNDSLGHDAGDELLVAVARRLEAILRPGDTVARFGGDEFTVLCEDLPGTLARERAMEIAERLTATVAQPFVVGGAETFVSASGGIALGGTGDERPEELLRDADAAMYHAKESGRGRIEVFDDTMRARALARHATENALHRALERNELRLFFQPVVSLTDARCTGVEALVRWQHPERGLLPPSEFVPLAEESGLIVELGAWMLEEAALVAARFQVEHDRDFVVSVNLSARQLMQPGMTERVAQVITRTGVRASNLCFEITESVLMDDAESVIAVIQRMRDLGVHLAIDDFGTGYSSLGYLKRFPIDIIKIDRSFVDGLASDPGDAAIVSAVIGLGHALGLRVIAEGVETAEQLEELVALGCDDAQGYFFAPPQPPQDIRQLLGGTRAWRPPGARIIQRST